MNRLGWAIAATFLIVAIGFALAVRPGSAPREMMLVPAPQTEPAILGPSGLAIPVAGVAAAALEDDFGQARDGGTRPHGALDIMAPRGTPVIAAAPGRVEKLFESAAGGHTLYVRSHDGGWIYYYAHLDGVRPGIVEGAQVIRAQPIATVGSSGNASPDAPHLHFEVKRMRPGEAWHDGEGIDPYPLLAGPAPHLAAGRASE